MGDWTAEELKDIAKRLRHARVTAGFARATEAVRKFGWNYSRYMNYENGERSIPPKLAASFAEAFGVTVDYIYFGNLPALTSGFRGAGSKAVRRVPLVDLEELGEFKKLALGFEPTDDETLPIAEDGLIPPRAIFIEIADRSMSDPKESVSFEPGDTALIDPDAAPSPSDFVLAIVPDERTALFRLYREVGRARDGSAIVDLIPLNRNYRTVRIAEDSPGEIVGVCRRVYRVVDLQSGTRKRI